jgi:hypothetical protein
MQSKIDNSQSQSLEFVDQVYHAILFFGHCYHRQIKYVGKGG